VYRCISALFKISQFIYVAAGINYLHWPIALKLPLISEHHLIRREVSKSALLATVAKTAHQSQEFNEAIGDGSERRTASDSSREFACGSPAKGHGVVLKLPGINQALSLELLKIRRALFSLR